MRTGCLSGSEVQHHRIMATDAATRTLTLRRVIQGSIFSAAENITRHGDDNDLEILPRETPEEPCIPVTHTVQWALAPHWGVLLKPDGAG